MPQQKTLLPELKKEGYNRSMYGVVDCNNFYASCERIFQPKLEKVPVVVLSNNDGCIISRSKEVKDLGVSMGFPAFTYKDLFKQHNVQVFSANFSLYADISSRIMKIISEFVPTVEIYSIDEAFFDVSGWSDESILHIGQTIRAAIMKQIGMPVSIGIAATKTLAKLGNEIAKTDERYNGVCGIFSDEERIALLKRLEVGDIWGIGRRLSAKLNSCGIDTAYQLTCCEDEWIRKELTISGLKTVWELRGTSCINLQDSHVAKKSIISSKSFGHLVTSLGELKEAVASFTSRAAEKLREEHEVASFIHVAITTNFHRLQDKQYYNVATAALPWPTHYTPTLIQTALNGLARIFKSGYKYKKATVTLTGLVDENTVQGNLFHAVTSSKEENKLMVVMDSLNKEWGSGTLQYAIQGIDKEWKGKSENKSARYTTRWEELVVVQS